MLSSVVNEGVLGAGIDDLVLFKRFPFDLTPNTQDSDSRPTLDLGRDTSVTPSDLTFTEIRGSFRPRLRPVCMNKKTWIKLKMS